jgi:hypothetical protein
VAGGSSSSAQSTKRKNSKKAPQAPQARTFSRKEDAQILNHLRSNGGPVSGFIQGIQGRDLEDIIERIAKLSQSFKALLSSRCTADALSRRVNFNGDIIWGEVQVADIFSFWESDEYKSI